MFERLELILNKDKIKQIQSKKILLIGVGGVGCSALEALIRSGIKDITVIDSDSFDLSNLNRQLLSLRSNIAKLKVHIAQDRCIDIDKDINIKALPIFLDKNNIDEILNNNYDYVIDACDTVSTKILLAKKLYKSKSKLISCMGTGNRFDPSKLEITDIYKTSNDPIAKIMRHELKKEHVYKLKVVASKEVPIKLNKSTPGSSYFVPNTAGIYLAYYVIMDIIRSDNNERN